MRSNRNLNQSELSANTLMELKKLDLAGWKLPWTANRVSVIGVVGLSVEFTAERPQLTMNVYKWQNKAVEVC